MELKIVPVLQVVVCGIAMLAVSKLVPSLDFDVAGKLIAGISIIGIGAFVSLIGVFEFRKKRTTTDPRYPERTTTLVTTGIYQISRNPMYLGFVIMLGGWWLILANVIPLIFVPLFVLYLNQFQIKPEEKVLSQKFQTEFRDYCHSVRRWL